MHVLHVFSTFGCGGPQLRLAAIIGSLGTGWSHTIAAMDGNFKAADHVPAETQVEYIAAPPRTALCPYPLVLHRLIRRIRPDLLVTYNWGAIEAVAGALIGSLCPIIHHEHGFGLDEASALKSRRVLARRLLLNRICATIVPSKTLLDIALRQYRIRPDKVRFVPNGVDVRRFRPQRSATLRARLGIPDDKLLFGYVGSLREVKNLPLLIDAFAAARLQDASLALVGEGPCRFSLGALVREHNLSNSVTFCGAAGDPAEYFAAFDVFVMSSASEQMPMSLLEAMACGLPAICTDVGDIGEMLGNPGAPALVPAGDLHAYVASLREMALRADLRVTLGTANRKRCVAEYTFERMIRNYEAAFYAAGKKDPTGRGAAA